MNRASSSLLLITLIATLGGLLFGFDMAVISGALPFVTDQFHLSDSAQGWFVSSALMGCVAGVAFSGGLSDRLGRKKMLMASALLFLLSAVGSALSLDFTMLVLARISGGVGVGVASMVAPLYISEIAPSNIRGRLVTFYQLAITAGILIAYATNFLLLQYAISQVDAPSTSFMHLLFAKDVWRGMIGIGAIPSILFLIGLFFVPESPRWLIQNNRREEGLDIIKSLTGTAIDTDHEVPAAEASSTSIYRELLSPAMRKPLLIGILLPVFSQFSGINAVIYYGPRILSDAGINISNAFLSQVIFGLANFIFTLIAIWKVDTMGRRPLYIAGAIGGTVSLLFTSVCFYTGATNNIALVISIILFLACFAFSLGPLKFVIAAEIFSTKIRGRAMAVSIMAMWVSDTIVGQLTPILLGRAGAAVTFCFFAVCCFLAFVTVYKLVPETKGKSLEEVEGMWH
ncbi:MAG: sugar porter family MFS transporter [Chitinophaga sp.]|uniref:sugar porter family MFS transporter n=1 Tax=Chitinophaga sp. TaxID=1869181 RepID=UPI001B237722|nr:sugar porter family MFS transporter [Chitinophaga sp.]MBO9727956.1 sugar porter family MFS transporter [Chitinophaga sp.]